MVILKVASSSDPNSVAGAIAGELESNGIAEVHSVGAGAVNQTVKAIAITRRLIEEKGNLTVIPGFIELEIEGKEITGLRFMINLDQS